jgi:hypothetical protein
MPIWQWLLLAIFNGFICRGDYGIFPVENEKKSG